MKRVFDRLIRFDARSREFPVTAILPTKKRRSYTWACNTWLDQGREGACAGFAVCHEAAARPCEVKNISNAVAHSLYKRAQKLDQWPGEAYEGTSVLAAVQAGVERGWYGQFYWAFQEEEVALAVGYKGTVLMGTDWYEGMCTPDSKGVIAPTGKKVGGHAYLIRGYNAKTGFYRIRNSWGIDWGVSGDCFIYREELNWLLHNRGEACIPVVRAKGL